ncbi:MAG: 4-vinyl reductase [Spirochaetales bacterium]|jgi:predicted hydrocarbon binding protein|nr:4-vinyl reductase [Spirochaetales bacterium]
MKKYEFSWDLIGDIGLGRPNLGKDMDLELYRLMQFTLRDVMERMYGTQAADRLFYEAGKLAGKCFYERYIYPVSSAEEFISKTQRFLREKKIGLLRVEEAKLDEGRLVLTVDEDLDCSGLPQLDYETCIYDEGFIAALMESFTQENWNAKEIDCWCTGARTCRFLVTKAEAGAAETGVVETGTVETGVAEAGAKAD